MRSWRRRCSAWWRAGEGYALALFVGLLLIAIVSGECAAREDAVFALGFRAGVDGSAGQAVRWGLCWSGGRQVQCARTREGNLIVVGR